MKKSIYPIGFVIEVEYKSLKYRGRLNKVSKSEMMMTDVLIWKNGDDFSSSPFINIPIIPIWKVIRIDGISKVDGKTVELRTSFVEVVVEKIIEKHVIHKIKNPTKKLFTSLDKRWLELRYKAILLHGKTCACCGKKSNDVHVDHIKPKSKYPELSYNLDNLQILCMECNIGKSNTDESDWRV